ncbi:MAG TPA: hypothetical protein VFE96_08075 [Candidatus Bathyarchaeia archaeon]|nr:hypothetical protein [Candidatus Bathyarchaeia archaeon]
MEERYEMLRKTLAHYLLLQVGTFVGLAGFDAVGPAMNMLTDLKANLKVEEIKKSGKDRAEALSQNLAESMGETFASDYDVEIEKDSRIVKLDRCGCIESVLARADDYGLTKSQARSMFCGTCIGSYRKASEQLQLGFKGKLRGDLGCSMSFSSK